MPIANNMGGLYTAIDDNYPKGTEPASLLDDAARALAGILKTAHSFKTATFAAGTLTLGADGGIFTVDITAPITSIVGSYGLSQVVLIATNATPQPLASSATVSIRATVQLSAGTAVILHKNLSGVFVVDAVLPDAIDLAAWKLATGEVLTSHADSLTAQALRIKALEDWLTAHNAQSTTYGGVFNTGGYSGHPEAASGIYPSVDQVIPPGVWEVQLELLASYQANSADAYAMTTFTWETISGGLTYLKGKNNIVNAFGVGYGQHYNMHHYTTLVHNPNPSNAVMTIKLGAGHNRNGTNWVNLFGNSWGENQLYATLIR